MRWIGRTTLAITVWILAAMTLVAGMPHFDCRCADGSVKPFGLGPLSRAAGCCCGNADRATPPTGPAAEAGPPACPCCQHQSQPTAARSESQAQWQTPGCTKLLVHRAPFIPAPGKAVSNEQTASQPLCLRGLAGTPTPPVAALDAARWPRSLPPPTDLVCLLQRLTI